MIVDPRSGGDSNGRAFGLENNLQKPSPARMLGRNASIEGRAQAGPTIDVVARGRSLWVGDETFFVRGVTYGTFRPRADDQPYPEDDVVAADFAAMAAAGLNAVRVYTPPPRVLLDMAQEHGLRVMVGVPWEQHVAFLGDRGRARDIEERLRDAVRECAGHPAILAYTIGNEIPAPVVRWHGPRRVERFLERLHCAAADADPGALVTYVNYPSTEYLHLPFLELVAFNVYLESRELFEGYLARLQNLAGDRPLLLTEVGLDSRRNGLLAQAASVSWQLRSAFAGGCAGAFVFSWTDEWHRGGLEVEDWEFGMTTRDRTPKPALAAVAREYAAAPGLLTPTPRVSVVVCTYNGEATLAECLEGVAALEYVDYEVIVVDDGSTDATPEIAARYPVRLIRTENRGLSEARNVGLQAAHGDVVAYIDDDARPVPHWLTYLMLTLSTGDWVGVGGPNLAPANDGFVADCVASAPGGPVHVLVSDTEAEHIPGCNMAFRRDAITEVGGFDPRFRTAGDDVDVCWRLQAAGGRIGFSPAAVVWHHSRGSIRGYWRQQAGYGLAEALLERKWPEKYNGLGHLRWRGRLYTGRGQSSRRRRIRYGRLGEGLFQSVYAPAQDGLLTLTSTPEWYLVAVMMSLLAVFGLVEDMGLIAAVLIAAVLLRSVLAAFTAVRSDRIRATRRRHAKAAVVGLLYLIQPLARLSGRIRGGLVPWKTRAPVRPSLRFLRAEPTWNEHWQAPERRLEAVVNELRDTGVGVRLAGQFERFDLEVRGGLLGLARMRMLCEEHGHGRQLVRVRWWPRPSRAARWGVLLLAGTAVAMVVSNRHTGAAEVLVVAGFVCLRSLWESLCAVTAGAAGSRRRETSLAPEPSLSASAKKT